MYQQAQLAVVLRASAILRFFCCARPEKGAKAPEISLGGPHQLHLSSSAVCKRARRNYGVVTRSAGVAAAEVCASGGRFARRPRGGAFQGLAGRVRRPRAQNTPAVLDSASRKCAASPLPSAAAFSVRPPPPLPRALRAVYASAATALLKRGPLPPLVRWGRISCAPPRCAWQRNNGALEFPPVPQNTPTPREHAEATLSRPAFVAALIVGAGKKHFSRAVC